MITDQPNRWRALHVPARPGRMLRSAAVFALLMIPASAAWAQAKQGEEPAGPPDPEETKLTTGDGVELAVTFYPARRKDEKSKDTIPVILLHMLGGSRVEYADFAKRLQAKGMSVLVPDLRGHGDSTTVRGSPVRLDASSMSGQTFERMVTVDMQRLKSFLLQKNNDGELNIEKLVVVGAEMGASVAMNWARFDWAVPPVGVKKQGQDVKALVLLSPEWTTKGLSLRTAMAGRPLTIRVWDDQLQRVFKEPNTINFNRPVPLDFRREASFLILVGKKQAKARADAKRLHRMLEPLHPMPPEAEREKKRDLYYGELDTTLQGTKLLGVQGLGVEGLIEQFIERRVVQRSFTWAVRSNPYSGRR